MFCAKATTDTNASIADAVPNRSPLPQDGTFDKHRSSQNDDCVHLVPLDVDAGSVSAFRALDEPTELHPYPSGTVLDDDGAHTGRDGGFSDQTKYVAEREQ